MKLTATQRLLLRCSAAEVDPKDGCGYGVTLRGAGNWATARALEKLELGWIQGGLCNGSALPGLFFANRDGVAMVAPEPEEIDE